MEPIALYGIVYDICNSTVEKTYFVCTNDSTYRDAMQDGKKVYASVKEYNEAHGISSSSVAESSSSVAEDLVKNCPQGEFALFTDILADVQKELYSMISSGDFNGLLPSDIVLSDTAKAYMDGLLDHDKKTLKGPFVPYLPEDYESDSFLIEQKSELWFDGYIAKTQTCADSTPVTTERYKAMREKILQESFKLILDSAVGSKS